MAPLSSGFSTAPWTPSRAPGTRTRAQRKQARRSAKRAEARASLGAEDTAACSRGAGTVPLGKADPNGEAPGEPAWHRDLEVDLSLSPAQQDCQ